MTDAAPVPAAAPTDIAQMTKVQKLAALFIIIGADRDRKSALSDYSLNRQIELLFFSYKQHGLAYYLRTIIGHHFT